ncbi:MAG: DEAD/DEAH box helicase [Nitrososphaeraceae archaeon]|jgi:ATP-dependent Lhr-like helicase|nr:DEAD/DEAH box helicase [Nitrososphaeraceae archaeon]MDW0156210.1 DEAD/DEAH box helicase [Nitrososphaeraceae archaeon]
MNVIDEQILGSFRREGFQNLTKIQKISYQVISRKQNCLLVAPTGSGKTEASMIPILSLLENERARNSHFVEDNAIFVLYITPLRALNNDVHRRIIDYAKRRNLDAQIRHGDTTRTAKQKMVKKPPHILITTPESLGIILTQEKFIAFLKHLRWIIIDEVHELIGNERGTHLTVSLERLQNLSSHNPVRIGLSATIGNLKDAANFIGGTDRKCSILVDNTIRNYDIDVKYLKGSISNAAKFVFNYLTDNKIGGSVLLFTNTRDEAEYIGTTIRNQNKIPVEVHHGSLSRETREETEEKLRQGLTGIVVCTSSLELGLDIGSVELVIHYGSSKQVSKLVQRIGRSRHANYKSAKGLIIANSGDDELECLAIINRMKKRSLEIQNTHTNSLDVAAHHLVGFVMSTSEPKNLGEIYQIIKGAYPFRELAFSDLEQCAALLDKFRIIKYDPNSQTYARRIKSYKYYFENISTIPNMVKFEVLDVIRKKRIGTLDQQFIGEFGERGNVFILKGTQWRIVSVDENKLQVNVEQVFGSPINIPHWVGEMIPVDYETAAQVGELRNKALVDSNLELGSDIKNTLQKIPIVPDASNIVIESVHSKNALVIHSTLGTKINNTLSSLFSTFLASYVGHLVETKSDPYRILLSSSVRLSKGNIEKILYDEYDVETILITSLTNTYNLNWRVWTVSKKFGLVDKNAVYDKRMARFIYDRYSKTPISKESLRELIHDKFDVKSTQEILRKIRNKEILIHWLDLSAFSPLTNNIIEHHSKSSSSPLSIERGVLDLIKERLEKTKHRLICIRCGKWERLVETREILDAISCKKCGSRLITTTFSSDYELSKIILSKLKGTEINSEQNHKFERAWKTASLINNFGKKALTVLSGYGIGVETAARILRNYVDDENLYKNIYDAERQYVTNRGFWNDK